MKVTGHDKCFQEYLLKSVLILINQSIASFTLLKKTVLRISYMCHMFLNNIPVWNGFPAGNSGKENPPANAGHTRDVGSIPG